MNLFPIPKGFDDILNDFAREVLRNMPKDIIDFGCEYFKAKQEGTQLNYQDKGEVLPNDEYVPKLVEKPNIIYAKNNLTQSIEDKDRFKNSMDTIDKLKQYDMPLREEKFGTREGYGKIREDVYEPQFEEVTEAKIGPQYLDFRTQHPDNLYGKKNNESVEIDKEMNIKVEENKENNDNNENKDNEQGGEPLVDRLNNEEMKEPTNEIQGNEEQQVEQPAPEGEEQQQINPENIEEGQIQEANVENKEEIPPNNEQNVNEENKEGEAPKEEANNVPGEVEEKQENKEGEAPQEGEAPKEG